MTFNMKETIGLIMAVGILLFICGIALGEEANIISNLRHNNGIYAEIHSGQFYNGIRYLDITLHNVDTKTYPYTRVSVVNGNCTADLVQMDEYGLWNYECK